MAGGPIGYILALKIDISYTIIKFPKIVNLSLLFAFCRSCLFTIEADLVVRKGRVVVLF